MSEDGLRARLVEVEAERDELLRHRAILRAMLDAAAIRHLDPDRDGGWFADVDREQTGEYVWQPCLETGQGHIPCFAVWFKTRAECEAYIRDTILPVASTMTPDNAKTAPHAET